jgi:PhzF family phenazine biosynthesis protein
MNLYQVDAFTSEMFKGNPAAVCLFLKNETDGWMQNMAAEMNLSETAFVKEVADGYNLRWFTPTQEVDLCGHATLAAAHVLWKTGNLETDKEARFYTQSGVLKAKMRGDWIQLDFPLEADEPAGAPPGLAEALRAEPLYVGKNRLDYLVEIDSEKTLRNLAPNLEIIKRWDARGLIVTCKSDSADFDFLSRFFAPACGINEDPVTGSAHCCLGPYWKRKLGKSELSAFQASRRGGVLKIKVGERVYLSGQARTVFQGSLTA